MDPLMIGVLVCLAVLVLVVVAYFRRRERRHGRSGIGDTVGDLFDGIADIFD